MFIHIIRPYEMSIEMCGESKSIVMAAKLYQIHGLCKCSFTRGCDNRNAIH